MDDFNNGESWGERFLEEMRQQAKEAEDRMLMRYDEKVAWMLSLMAKLDDEDLKNLSKLFEGDDKACHQISGIFLGEWYRRRQDPGAVLVNG